MPNRNSAVRISVWPGTDPAAAQRLWEAIARLKDLDREALLAFYIHGQSLVEIAEQLDVPIGTIKRRLHTARKRLKAELEAGAVEADEWSDALPSVEDDPDLIGASVSESAWR